jgi:hypothetical protein
MRLLPATTLLLLLGCAARPTVDIEPLPLATLESADPVEDATTAFQNGDTRFAGILMYALVVPGVPGELVSAVERAYGIRVIDPEGDHFEDLEHALKIRSLSVPYAVRYNRHMLTLLTARADSLSLPTASMVREVAR